MGKQSLKDKIKEFITGIAFKVFLWGIEMTDDQYWKNVYEGEKIRIEHPEAFSE